MKRVLVLGAGMVSRPLVAYLLDSGYHLTVADIRPDQAAAVLDGHANGRAQALDIQDEKAMARLIADADLVVSLLPPSFHMKPARGALERGKHFLTASYISPEMQALDEEVKAKGLIFLNEVGLDPGLDHFTAMEIIDKLKDSGYAILDFHSHCGGLPSRAAANNPLRYKMSWSPAGVLGALTRPSKYRRDGNLVEVPGKRKLEYAEIIHIPGAGIFESNPNADSLFYGERYGLDQVRTIRRGTLRYPGWANFWLFMLSLGFLDQEKKMDFNNEQVLHALFRLSGATTPANIFDFVHEIVRDLASMHLEKMESLGLLDPKNTITGNYSAFQILLEQSVAHLNYAPGERDLVILHHEFVAEKDGRQERWSSTLTREGAVDGTSAMAFLVGVPAGIAARMILEDKITARGVLMPLAKEIYAPILEELARLGLPHTIERTPL